MENDTNGKPRSIDERLEALTMNLELMSHTVEAMRDAMGAIAQTTLDHDRQIGQLLALAQAQNDRITRLEDK